MLSSLLTHPQVANVSAFTRRPLSNPDPNSRLHSIVDKDFSVWISSLSNQKPPPQVFLSGLGTTRGQAGSLANQRKIDYALNLDLAKAAKQAGVKVYVLISSGGADKNSYFPYTKMKGELESAVSELGFEKTVILRPGLIIGPREDSRPPEYAFRMLATAMGKISGGLLKDFWAQDAEVIGRAAVNAGLQCLDGTAPEGKVWTLGIGDINRLGMS